MESAPAFQKVLKFELCSLLPPKKVSGISSLTWVSPDGQCHTDVLLLQQLRLLSEGTWPLQEGSGAFKGDCVCPKVGIG